MYYFYADKFCIRTRVVKVYSYEGTDVVQFSVSKFS